MAGGFMNRIRVLTGSEDTSSFESSSPAVERIQKTVARLPENALLTSYHYRGEDVSGRECRIVFPQSAYEQVVQHLSHDTKREHGGFLLGYETTSGESEFPTVVIERAVPAKNTQGTPVRLTFTTETWREFDLLTESLRHSGLSLQRVGWYHSHPDIAIFLSRWDLDVCRTFDRRRYPVALVVDPIGNRGGFFFRKKSGYEPHSPQGFDELHDLKESSVVTWNNMIRSGEPSAQADRETGTTTPEEDPKKLEPIPKKPELQVSGSSESPSQAPVPVASTQKPSNQPIATSNSSGRSTDNKLVTAAALVLFAILGGEGLLYVNQRDLSNRIAQLASEQSVLQQAIVQFSSDKGPVESVHSDSQVSVLISPEKIELAAGQKQAFKVTIEGSANNEVSWSMMPPLGSISADGVYTAPSTVRARQVVSVRATSTEDPSKSAEATVTVKASTTTTISVLVEPAQAMLSAGAKEKFVAHVKGGAETVKWSLRGKEPIGELSSDGEYTAPAELRQSKVVEIVATSTVDKTKSGVAKVTLQAAEGLTPETK